MNALSGKTALSLGAGLYVISATRSVGFSGCPGWTGNINPQSSGSSSISFTMLASETTRYHLSQNCFIGSAFHGCFRSRNQSPREIFNSNPTSSSPLLGQQCIAIASARDSRDHPVPPRNSGMKAQSGEGHSEARILNSSLLLIFSELFILLLTQLRFRDTAPRPPWIFEKIGRSESRDCLLINLSFGFAILLGNKRSAERVWLSRPVLSLTRSTGK
jgi:hypothetical protein